MDGRIATTDPGWWGFLRTAQGAGTPFDEVNFWGPSPRGMVRAQPGEPWLFKLKAPASAIAGFGIVQRVTTLPPWLAWEAFGRANGVDSLAELEDRLGQIRARNRVAGTPSLEIACYLLSDPVVFDEADFVALPADWKRTSVRPVRYDLARGEGARVWRQCLDAAARSTRAAPVAAEGPRWGTPQWVRPRLGQGGFRVAVTEAYGKACAVTREHSLPVLEAAHIRPYSEGGAHAVTNGLLLRSDLHRLFDRGYVTITPEGRFRVGQRLADEYRNGRVYYALHDTPIALPHPANDRPDPDALAWHGATRFAG